MSRCPLCGSVGTCSPRHDQEATESCGHWHHTCAARRQDTETLCNQNQGPGESLPSIRKLNVNGDSKMQWEMDDNSRAPKEHKYGYYG